VRRCNVVGGTGKNFDEREERDKERELGLEGRNVRIVYEARVWHSVGSGSSSGAKIVQSESKQC
jgi:hypothetical protein